MIFNVITWNINPEIFSIGNHGIRWYGLMFAVAFSIGYWIFKRYLRGDKLTSEMLDSLLVHIAIGVIVGARLGHCFFYEPDYYLKNPLEIHGFAIGLLLALWLYYRKYKIPFLWLIDRIAIVVALGCAFIRIGNFFNSEIYGLPTNLPWGVEFVRDRLYDSTTGEILPTIARHPTQIYEALSYILIFIALFVFYRKKNMEVRDGFIFGVSMSALFSARL